MRPPSRLVQLHERCGVRTPTRRMRKVVGPPARLPNLPRTTPRRMKQLNPYRPAVNRARLYTCLQRALHDRGPGDISSGSSAARPPGLLPGVGKLGHPACFGCRTPQVRILPPGRNPRGLGQVGRQRLPNPRLTEFDSPSPRARPTPQSSGWFLGDTRACKACASATEVRFLPPAPQTPSAETAANPLTR